MFVGSCQHGFGPLERGVSSLSCRAISTAALPPAESDSWHGEHTASFPVSIAVDGK